MDSREVIKKKLELAIKDINRNLYEWTQTTKKGSLMQKPDNSLIKNLISNWIKRELKATSFFRQIEHTLSKLLIRYTINSEYRITMIQYEILCFCSYKKEVEEFNALLAEIDYSKLGYSVVDENVDFTRLIHFSFQ